MERIVVGVDGSTASREALRWAVDEARRRDAVVEAVHAWRLPLGALGSEGTRVITPEAWEQRARDALDHAVAAVDATGLRCPIERLLVSGDAAHGVMLVAKGADLLVVGSRGFGSVAGLLLGSVGTQCIHQAPCPVVVVRPRAA